MKQLSSFMVMSVDGRDRVSYTYNEIDENTGDLISANNKGSFYVVDEKLQVQIDETRDFINTNRLEEK